MNKYKPTEFIYALGEKMKGRNVPNCPYCGGHNFTSTDKFATILIGDDTKGINLGPSIPSGMIVCETCGHIEFFALGALGLLRNEEEEKDAK